MFYIYIKIYIYDALDYIELCEAELDKTLQIIAMIRSFEI